MFEEERHHLCMSERERKIEREFVRNLRLFVQLETSFFLPYVRIKFGVIVNLFDRIICNMFEIL